MEAPGPMLRPVHASWFERLFLSKINFHYHAEHHLWPWISYQHLPEMNARLWQNRKPDEVFMYDGNMMFMDDDYSSSLRDVIKGR